MANCTVTPSTLTCVARLYAPAAISSFPILSRKPNQVFSDEKLDDAVMVGDVASGHPLLNKLVTFDARTFDFELPAVPEAEKILVMDYYENHKDVPFPWYNDQDHAWYEVVFLEKPSCRLDGRGDLWLIGLKLRQWSR